MEEYKEGTQVEIVNDDFQHEFWSETSRLCVGMTGIVLSTLSDAIYVAWDNDFNWGVPESCIAPYVEPELDISKEDVSGFLGVIIGGANEKVSCSS